MLVSSCRHRVSARDGAADEAGRVGALPAAGAQRAQRAGVPVARVIHNFGREDRLDREGLVRLVRSIQRFLGGEETLRASTPEGFRFLGAPEAGGPQVLDRLWSELGIGRAVSRVAGA